MFEDQVKYNNKKSLFTLNFMEFFNTILQQILLENVYYCAWQASKYLALHYSKNNW